jgi:hypothetical protein
MLTFARVRALAIVVGLGLVALITVSAAILRDTSTATATGNRCGEGDVVANLRLPDPTEIKINVYNATDQTGLAARVGENFSNRDFQVLGHDDEPQDAELSEVAVLRYGPQAVGAAHVLRAYFLNTAVTEFDLNRTDDVVDVVIGSGFRQLATETEVRQSIAALGNPIPPPGTCVA